MEYFECVNEDMKVKIFTYASKSGFSGLVVSMLASGTQDRGFNPGRSRRILRVKKSTACLPGFTWSFHVGTSKGGGKQWQPTPKKLPRIQCA